MSLPKNCMGCPHLLYCWDEHYYEGKIWCYRDKENLIPFKIAQNDTKK